tara:strand:- start:1439 stop:1714 length:276 start_codon:yes stop_codon:yes gene_type:complete
VLKSNIENEISRIFNLDQDTSHAVVSSLIDSISSSISNNNRVEIRGFGSFFSKEYKAYKGRNPKTGESVEVSEKILPLFRPSKELLSKLNK